MTGAQETDPNLIIVRTWRVRAGPSARVAALAAATNLTRNQSALVDALLAAALDDIDAGRLVIHTVAVKHAIAKVERR